MRALHFVGAVIAALAVAATGAYVLWQFHTGWGLLAGVTLVVLGVAIALPVQFHDGVIVVRENTALLVPVIVGALKGGDRKSDPPADPPAPLGPG